MFLPYCQGRKNTCSKITLSGSLSKEVFLKSTFETASSKAYRHIFLFSK
jgi:hypothetical protein